MKSASFIPPASVVPKWAMIPNAGTDFVLLAALEEEREALRRKLPPLAKLPPSGEAVHVYYAGDFPVSFSDGREGSYRVILLSVGGMGRVKAADVAGAAINRWRPRFVVLVGIAGGIASADVRLGDVLVADQIVDYELQKLRSDGPRRRYEVHQADARLLAAASNLDTTWTELIETPRPVEGAPSRFIGPIATGDKVIAATGALTEYLREWPKLIGVEMEAGGAARAAHGSARKPGFFMVRSVSDLADAAQEDPATRAWRSYACDVAASYTVGLLRSGPAPLKRRSTAEESGRRLTRSRRVGATARSPAEVLLLVSAPLVEKAADEIYWPYRYDYESSIDAGRTFIRPRADYFAAVQDGKPLPEVTYDTGGSGPFGLVFPELEIRVLNNSSRTLVVSELAVMVERSALDTMPIVLAARPLYAPRSFWLINEGWGGIASGELRYHFQADSSRPKASFDNHRYDLAVPPFRAATELDVSAALAREGVDVAALEALRTHATGVDGRGSYVQIASDPTWRGRMAAAEHHQRVRAAYGPFNTQYDSGQVKLFGTLTYSSETEGPPAILCFRTSVRLFGSRSSDEDDRWYEPYRTDVPGWDILLPVDRADYTRAARVNVIVKAGEMSTPRLRIAAARSSIHTLRIRATYNNGDSVVSDPVELRVFVPRSNTRVLERALAERGA
jgi:nucleoside phosphorylase